MAGKPDRHSQRRDFVLEKGMQIDKPNYTQLPNIVLDNMGAMSDPQLRVVLAICRKTFGWHKDRDRISLSQLKTMTGMSKPSVIAGINAALEDGMVLRHQAGDSYEYELVVKDFDQGVVKEFDQGSKGILLGVVKEFDTQKKLVKETNQKKQEGPDKPATPPAVATFREAAKRYPSKAQYGAIESRVGCEPDRLALWRRVVEGYILCGWNPRNVSGMLEFFERGEVPQTSAKAQARPVANGSGAMARALERLGMNGNE